MRLPLPVEKASSCARSNLKSIPIIVSEVTNKDILLALTGIFLATIPICLPGPSQRESPRLDPTRSDNIAIKEENFTEKVAPLPGNTKRIHMWLYWIRCDSGRFPCLRGAMMYRHHALSKRGSILGGQKCASDENSGMKIRR